jgi:anti-sigma regulatory factor (Ser/Thr protein kinase)
MSASSLELARLRLQAREDLVAAAVHFVSSAAQAQGMLATDLPRLELALEEACLNVVQHAYEGDRRAHYEIVVETRPPDLVVSVEDQGLPFDLRHPKESTGLHLMRAFADRVEFLNLGKGGKRVELIKSLPYRDLESYLETAPEPPAPLDPDTPLELRLMRPEDTAGLARCAYRCYGFSYSRDSIYRPERFEELLRQGLIISAVAVAPDGEVMAHVALSRNSLDDKIADSGQAITDPRLRGRNLFTSLKQLLAKEARRIGLYGLYSESVTIHPYTQKANLKLGAVETALLLGFAPATVQFKQLAELPVRSAAMVTYLRVGQEPGRINYLPTRHAPFLKQLYDRLKLDRELRVEESPLEGESILDVVLIPELTAAHFFVPQAGEGLGQEVRRRLQKADVTYLDLPLSAPSTPAACRSLEREGFYLAGLVPEACPQGDVLRMQKLHCAMQTEESLHTASEWGSQLKSYVLGERQRLAQD